jgi:hypothetical protein
MLLKAGVAAFSPLLRTFPARLAAMSTGTFTVSQPLNYRGGARVEPADSSGTEKAFEPATGNPMQLGGRLEDARGPPRPCLWGAAQGPWAQADCRSAERVHRGREGIRRGKPGRCVVGSGHGGPKVVLRARPAVCRGPSSARTRKAAERSVCAGGRAGQRRTWAPILQR